MFGVICHYRFDAKNSAAIYRQIREGFVSPIHKARGFSHYYWLYNGKGWGASFGLFADKAGADESVLLAAEFVRNHLSRLLMSKPEIIEGRVVAHD